MERKFGYSSNCAPSDSSADLEQVCLRDAAGVVDLRLDRSQAWELDADVWVDSMVDVAFVSGSCPTSMPRSLCDTPFRLVVPEDLWASDPRSVRASVDTIRTHGRVPYLETHWSQGSGTRFAQAIVDLDAGVVADSFGLWRMLGPGGLHVESELGPVLAARTTALQVKGIAAQGSGWIHTPLDQADREYLQFVAELVAMVPASAPVLIETKASPYRDDLRAVRTLTRGTPS